MSEFASKREEDGDWQAEAKRLAQLIKDSSGLHWTKVIEIKGLEKAYAIRHRDKKASLEDYRALLAYAREHDYHSAAINSPGTFIHNLIPDTRHLEGAIKYKGSYLHFAKSVDNPGKVSLSKVELQKGTWDDRMPKYELLRQKGSRSTVFIGGYIKTDHQLILLGSQEAIVDVRTHFFRIGHGGRETFLDGLINGTSGRGILFSGPCCMIKGTVDAKELGLKDMTWVEENYPEAAKYLNNINLIKLHPPRLD